MQCRSKTKHFNPRSYKRSDDPEFDLFSPKFEISIHAPTRGATLKSLLKWVTVSQFQSTLLQEERPLCDMIPD